MKEIGEYLKNRRIELGISLEEAEQYLKIRKKYLVAIEEADERVLPGRTYFVGYLRNYANYLEADQEHISQLLGEKEQARKTSEPEPVESVSKRTKPGRYFSPEKRKYRIKREKKTINYIPFIKIAVIIFLIGGSIFIVNQFLQRTKQPSITMPQDNGIISESSLSEEKSLEEELTEMAEENIQREEMAETPSDIFLEPLPEYEPIRIVAQEPTWVKVMQDDQVLFESLILAAEEITIKSGGTVSLLTTSSDDISVFYEEQTIEPQPFENHRLMLYQIIPNNENN